MDITLIGAFPYFSNSFVTRRVFTSILRSLSSLFYRCILWFLSLFFFKAVAAVGLPIVLYNIPGQFEIEESDHAKYMPRIKCCDGVRGLKRVWARSNGWCNLLPSILSMKDVPGLRWGLRSFRVVGTSSKKSIGSFCAFSDPSSPATVARLYNEFEEVLFLSWKCSVFSPSRVFCGNNHTFLFLLSLPITNH